MFPAARHFSATTFPLKAKSAALDFAAWLAKKHRNHNRTVSMMSLASFWARRRCC
jgi:hypothetical protein